MMLEALENLHSMAPVAGLCIQQAPTCAKQALFDSLHSYLMSTFINRGTIFPDEENQVQND